MRYILIHLILSSVMVVYCQVKIEYLSEVPLHLKNKTNIQFQDYNPLHVGDIWQYTYSGSGAISYVKIIKDTVVNGKNYFLKDYGWDFYNWERYDSSSLSSYKLDIEDLDRDGFFNDEVLVDSFSISDYSMYNSYKYSGILSGSPRNEPISTIITETQWALVFGDTVLVKFVEYLDIFLMEDIADKYGTLWYMLEGPPDYLSGAIIDGVQYGTLVSVKENEFNNLNFSLSQNYPNPFNPSTTISYSIPEKGWVKLKVFDMIGRETKTLVSKEQSPGNYVVVFDGSNLSSGIYFYKLQAGKFIDTKKMILVK
ncbi:T9SS type A sorting domain-containing protein [Bacteroidota bacterium]